MAMRPAILLLILLLSGCERSDGDRTAGQDSPARVQTAELTGLYEARGEGGHSARMCMISDPSGTASFAIVTERSDAGSCGGAGEAVREASLLRLTMAGDEECVIEARIDGAQVTLPPSLPERCGYYCGAGATLAGTMLEKTGGTEEDAMRATDLAGDPLCG